MYVWDNITFCVKKVRFEGPYNNQTNLMSNCSKLNSSKKECPYSLTCVDKKDACPLNRLEILKLPLDN